MTLLNVNVPTMSGNTPKSRSREQGLYHVAVTRAAIEGRMLSPGQGAEASGGKPDKRGEPVHNLTWTGS